MNIRLSDIVRRAVVLPLVISALLLFLPGTASGTGRALYLEKINIAGQENVKEAEILDTMQLSPGDSVNAAILETARQKMINGIYLITDADLSTRPGSERGYVILDIEVEERNTLSIETGFGYDDIYGWFLTLLGVRFDPLFGSESQLRLGARLGYNLSGIDAEWETRHTPGRNLGSGANAHIYNQKLYFYTSSTDAPPEDDSGDQGTTDWREYRQDINRSGLEVFLTSRPGSHTKFSYGVRIESVDPDTTIHDEGNDQTLGFNEIPDDLQEDIDKTLITGFLLRMVRDSRDLVSYPRSGSLLLVSFQYNSTLLGGDAIYSKFRLDLRKHIQVGGWKVLSSRITAGITTPGTPYYNRYYIGGIYSIRGFRELSLSPPSGDDSYWLVNEELRVPLISSSQGIPRLTGILFFDAGQGWKRGTALTSSDIQAAFGYGVSLRLPWLGMLGLNVGVPLTEGRTGENYRMHLLLGFDF